MISGNRLAGIAGLLSVTTVLVFAIVLPSAIAGNRVSGTLDPLAILAYYNHPALAWTSWPVGIFSLFFLVFICGIYLALRDKSQAAGTSVVLLAGTAMAIVEVPVLFTQSALQSALVAVAFQHAAATDSVMRAALEAFSVGAFRFWDVLYNSLAYWLEAGYTLLFSFVVLRTRAISRFVGGVGVVTSAYQIFNSAALPLGVADIITLPGNLLFVIWFLAVSVSLIRLKTERQ